MKAVSVQGQRCEERRAGGHGMHGGPEVVQVAGQRERQSARCASGLCFGFVYVHVQAGLRENDRGGEAVGSGADDGCLGHI